MGKTNLIIIGVIINICLIIGTIFLLTQKRYAEAVVGLLCIILMIYDLIQLIKTKNEENDDDTRIIKSKT